MTRTKPIGELALRYLDGALSRREVAALNSRLKRNTLARREFARALLLEVQLREGARREGRRARGCRNLPAG